MKIILVAEDEEDILMPLAEFLADADKQYRVIPAANGREAINVLLSIPVDLVVTDLRMPVMDGFAVLSHVQRLHPRVPVIVVTAYDTAENRARIKDLGE